MRKFVVIFGIVSVTVPAALALAGAKPVKVVLQGGMPNKVAPAANFSDCTSNSDCTVPQMCTPLTDQESYCALRAEGFLQALCCVTVETNSTECGSRNGMLSDCVNVVFPGATIPMCVYRGANQFCNGAGPLTSSQVFGCLDANASEDSYPKGDCDKDNVPNADDCQPCIADDVAVDPDFRISRGCKRSPRQPVDAGASDGGAGVRDVADDAVGQSFRGGGGCDAAWLGHQRMSVLWALALFTATVAFLRRWRRAAATRRWVAALPPLRLR